MAEVRLENIQKRVGRNEIIPDLTLTIMDGELFILVGPSGSGKSTLLHLIAGLETPTAGRILFDGRDVTTAEPRERDVALVFQTYALYPHMTVAENLAFPLRVAPGAAARDRVTIEREVRRVAARLGLEPLLPRRPRELSGGQRQRVALGRALIRQPRVFLLDEPLSNLDPQLRGEMRAELRRLHDELGITMIYVTHDQTEALTLADRVAVLDHGRLQQVGTPDELYRRPRNTMVAGFIGHPAMNVWEARLDGGYAVAGPLRMPAPFVKESRVVHLGVRPEEVCVRPGPGPGPGRKAEAGVVAGVVRLVEPAGLQTWVTVRVDGDRGASVAMTIVGLAEDKFRPKVGEGVTVWMGEARPYLFDAGTGLRVEAEEAA